MTSEPKKTDPNAADMPQPTAFTSNKEAWHAGFVLIRKLHHLRGLHFSEPNDQALAEELIKAYARCLRLSEAGLIVMSRLQRDYRLTPEGIVPVLYALTGFLGIRHATPSFEAVLLAVGFDPPRHRHLCRLIDSNHGLGRLLRREWRGQLLPTETLIEIASNGKPISDEECELFRKKIDGDLEMGPGDNGGPAHED